MHTRHVTALALFGALQCSSNSRAQECIEPTNERCDSAIEFVFEDLPLSIEELLGCENNMVDRPYFDLFYRYDCTVTGDYQFDMCGTTGDSYMRVYTDGCGFLPATSWVEDDDGCPGSPSTLDPLITTRLEAGRSYWVEVGAWRPAEQFPPNANDPFRLNVEYLGLCSIDLNIDGVVNFTDVELFVSLFISGDLDADLFGDGQLDIFDFLEFLETFQRDCF